MTEDTIHCRACVVGGGPAGMMLGLLLARAGIEVAVLEKHADFLRDFRGDTVHPSTLELLHELGLIEDFLARPHQEARSVSAEIGTERFAIADFSHLPVRSKFIALMPQWDFLDLLAQAAKRYSGFRLLMECEARDLLIEDGRVVGIAAGGASGARTIRADLVVAADGRRSRMRERAGLSVIDVGAPIDVLWFRLPRSETDPDQPLGRIDPGQFTVLINRGAYFQCALVIPKDGFAGIRAEGLPAFESRVARAAPLLANRVGAIGSFEDVKLLTVTIDRLARWHRPGLLCIGDAAHAMSPVGGIGINLAVQDAVAAANLLAGPLAAPGPVPDAALAAVERRRAPPTRLTQALQVLVQDRIIMRTLTRRERMRVPLALRLLSRFPRLRRLPARIIGLGFRPEHVATPERPTPRSSSLETSAASRRE